MEDELWGKDELIKQIRDNWNNNNPAMNQKITTTTEKINDNNNITMEVIGNKTKRR